MCSSAYLPRCLCGGCLLSHLDVLHLDGVLCVAVRVVELAHIHSGVLGLMRGGRLGRARTHQGSYTRCPKCLTRIENTFQN